MSGQLVANEQALRAAYHTGKAALLPPLQLAVRHILQYAPAYPWSVQGFGLLRLYIGRVARLHIWDSSLRYGAVSMIHDHSWDLESVIVAGSLVNKRYVEADFGARYMKHRLITGYNTAVLTGPHEVGLVQVTREVYLPGDTYRQRKDEIHQTDAEDSTITLMQRREDENGEATVYWPANESWGTAKPRPATEEEILRVTLTALKKHFPDEKA